MNANGQFTHLWGVLRRGRNDVSTLKRMEGMGGKKARKPSIKKITSITKTTCISTIYIFLHICIYIDLYTYLHIDTDTFPRWILQVFHLGIIFQRFHGRETVKVVLKKYDTQNCNREIIEKGIALVDKQLWVWI